VLIKLKKKNSTRTTKCGRSSTIFVFQQQIKNKTIFICLTCLLNWRDTNINVHVERMNSACFTNIEYYPQIIFVERINGERQILHPRQFITKKWRSFFHSYFTLCLEHVVLRLNIISEPVKRRCVRNEENADNSNARRVFYGNRRVTTARRNSPMSWSAREVHGREARRKLRSKTVFGFSCFTRSTGRVRVPRTHTTWCTHDHRDGRYPKSEITRRRDDVRAALDGTRNECARRSRAVTLPTDWDDS